MATQNVVFTKGLSASMPSQIVPGTVLVQVDTGNMFLDNDESTRVQIKDNTKLPLTGGDISGGINFTGNLGVSFDGRGVLNTDGSNTVIDTPWSEDSAFHIAVNGQNGTYNKLYVFGQETIDFSNSRVINVGNPQQNSDAVNKSYVDQLIFSTGKGDFMANGSVPMTGSLNMSGNSIINFVIDDGALS